MVSRMTRHVYIAPSPGPSSSLLRRNLYSIALLLNMRSTFALCATALVCGVALADFKIVQVDSYPAFGGSCEYSLPIISGVSALTSLLPDGGTTATQDAVATAGGGTPSCGASAGNGFGCDGCGCELALQLLPMSLSIDPSRY